MAVSSLSGGLCTYSDPLAETLANFLPRWCLGKAVCSPDFDCSAPVASNVVGYGQGTRFDQAEPDSDRTLILID